MPTQERAIQALGLQTVLEALASRTRCSASAAFARNLRPLTDRKALKARFDLISDLRLLIQQADPLGLSPYEDLRPSLALLAPEDAVLEPASILAFAPVLTNLGLIADCIAGHPDLHALADSAATLQSYPDLLSTIYRTLDSDGTLLDTASPELASLREQIRSLERRITRRLETITHDPQHSGFLQDSFVTKRSGRWVLPVRMDSKGMVEGVVHDVSRTGETAFMEPLEIIGLSNELENLSAEARAEEIRILRALTRRLRAVAPEIHEQFGVLLQIDALEAGASLSETLGAEEPEINEGGSLILRSARHPILMLMRTAPGSKHPPVVPLDLALEMGLQTIVITGPNAGGKTIAIKTAGILHLMAQCGLPVTAKGSSSFPLGASLYVDIGDEQSLEQSLSTFSAHMKNIAGLIESAAEGDLVLIDELGTGTEPLQGAALGAAVLAELKKRGALTLATTHLMDIVGYVHSEPGMSNASMLFDSATHRPLYRLVPGEPGASHALDVAEACGLPEGLVKAARARLGSTHLELHDMIEELKTARARHEAEEASLKAERAALLEERRALQSKVKSFEAEKRSALQKVLDEARALVAEARSSVASLLEAAKKDKPRAALRALDRIQTDVHARIEGLAPEGTLSPASSATEAHGAPIEPADLKPGDLVYVTALSSVAEVMKLEARGKSLRLRTPDGKEITLAAKGLYAPPSGHARAERKSAASRARVTVSTSNSSKEHPESAPLEIKLIGLRVEEALERLEPFLNHASLSGLGYVRVIHGMGTGALRNAVRETLKQHPLVASFEQAPPEQGGAGATIAYLRQ